MVLKNLILGSLLVLVSCKRDYSCTCTYTTKPGDSSFKEHFKIPDTKGHRALRVCLGAAEKYPADSINGGCKLFHDRL